MSFSMTLLHSMNKISQVFIAACGTDWLPKMLQIKGIGGRSESKIFFGVFEWFWKFRLCTFRNFLRNRKSLPCCRSALSRSWRVPQNPVKSYTFLDFRLFQSQNWANLIFLAPNNFWSPIFGQVVPFYEFSKRYLGIWLIFWFLAIFGGPKLKNSQKSVKNRFFAKLVKPLFFGSR